jgi:protein-L-isoaspartate(D-aspartate) O-methyltransferase
MTSFHDEKERLIQRLKARGYLKTEQMERAFIKVPREEFVPSYARGSAYVDSPLSIGHGQTISAPHMCAIMCEGLQLEEGMRVLEVGAGSGYHAALCAEIVAPEESENPGRVFTIEIVEHLIDFAKDNLERAGYADRVTVIHADGGKGLPEHSPFDRILVAAAAPQVPKPLIDQLKPNGIMLIPVGSRGFYQELMLVTKSQEGKVSTQRWGGVAFVPLTGEYGH